MAYTHIPYPKVLRHMEGTERTVQNLEEHQALGSDWFESSDEVQAALVRLAQSGILSDLLPYFGNHQLVDSIYKVRFEAARGPEQWSVIKEYKENFPASAYKSTWAEKLLPDVPTGLAQTPAARRPEPQADQASNEWRVRMEIKARELEHKRAGEAPALIKAEESELSKGSQQDGARQAPEELFTHSPDYRSVQIEGQAFQLTQAQAQAALIKILDENRRNGTPNAGISYILEDLEKPVSQHSKWQDIFKNNKAAKKGLIVSRKKGTLRLNVPDTPKGRFTP